MDHRHNPKYVQGERRLKKMPALRGTGWTAELPVRVKHWTCLRGKGKEQDFPLELRVEGSDRKVGKQQSEHEQGKLPVTAPH